MSACGYCELNEKLLHETIEKMKVLTKIANDSQNDLLKMSDKVLQLLKKVDILQNTEKNV